MNALNGYKTYIVAAATVCVVILQHLGIHIVGVDLPDQAAIDAVLAACIRHGIANA